MMEDVSPKLPTPKHSNKFHAKEPLTAHWNSKLLEDLTTKKSVDRLSVFVYGCKC